MAWSALVFSRDPDVMSALAPALGEIGMAATLAQSPEGAVEALENAHFDAALLDCAPGDDLAGLLRQVHAASRNSKLVVVAIVSQPAMLQAAFSESAHFVISRPLTPDVTRRTLRAVAGLLHRMARHYPRRTVHTLSLVAIDGSAEKAMMLQLGEGGMGIQALEPLEVRRQLRLRFEIPGTQSPVEATGEIVWADPSGRIGVRFVGIEDPQRRQLREWVLNDALENAAGAEALSEIAAGSPAGGTFRFVPAPQRLCAALLDGLIVLLATAVFEVVALSVIRTVPHRLMAQATALAIPCLFWSVYQYLFVRGLTPGGHASRRIAMALAAQPSHGVSSLLTAPLRALWRSLSRLGARLELAAPGPAAPAGVSIQPPAAG